MLTRLRSLPCRVVARAGWRWLPRGLPVLLVVAAITRGRAAADEFDPRDLRHEVLCRQVLADDPALRPLNLIVRVTDRVATLQGPVPTRELARRALQTLRKLPELREVRDRMMVQFEDDPGQLLS